MRAEPFVPEPGLSARRIGAERREHVDELRAIRLIEPGETARLEALEVLVERIDENPERQLSFELRRAPGEHEVASLLGAHGQLGEQACLAHPQLAYQRERRRAFCSTSVRARSSELSSLVRPTSVSPKLGTGGVRRGA
jgi:hypothetical protein